MIAFPENVLISGDEVWVVSVIKDSSGIHFEPVGPYTVLGSCTKDCSERIEIIHKATGIPMCVPISIIFPSAELAMNRAAEMNKPK